MHGFANPARFLRIARWLTPLLFVAGLALAGGALVWGLTQVPPDRLMGDTVRILFIHVPAAWLGMAGWTTIAVASLVELVWRHPLAGIAARAAAVPGAVFTAICLVTGSIWARPTWGTWWVWDGRLTSFLVLLFLYFGYIALAEFAPPARQHHDGQVEHRFYFSDTAADRRAGLFVPVRRGNPGADADLACRHSGRGTAAPQSARSGGGLRRCARLSTSGISW